MKNDNLALRIAIEVLSKEPPETVFEGIMHETKKVVKQRKDEAFEYARSMIFDAMQKDLMSLRIPIHSLEVKLGRFRGHPFITSSKLEIDMMDEHSAKGFVKYLQNKFSSKFKLKAYSIGIARYNIR